MKFAGNYRPWIGVAAVAIGVMGLSIFLENQELDDSSAAASGSDRAIVAVKSVGVGEGSQQSTSGNDNLRPDAPAAAHPGPETSLGHAHSHAPVVLREETRDLDPPLRDLGRNFETEPFQEMEFPLFDGETVHLTSLRHVSTGAGAGVFTARVAGDAASHVVLSYVGEAESGTIQHPSANAYFEIRSNADGSSSYLTQVDPESFPPCAACLEGTHAGPL